MQYGTLMNKRRQKIKSMKHTDSKKNMLGEQLLAFLREQEDVQHPLQREEVWKRIVRRHRQQKVRRLVAWSTVAAAVLVGVLFLLPFEKRSSVDLMEYVAGLQQVDAETSNSVRLVTSSGASIALQEKTQSVSYDREGLAYADDKRLEVPAEGVNTATEKSTKDKAQEEVKYNRLLVPLGKHIRLALSDGSVLDVNSGSEVVYPTVFSEDKREIFVNGEIFIDVKKTDKGTPFVVRTSRCDVRVLGTAFNVRAYDSDVRTEVVLQRGVVEVEDQHKQVVRMKPDERTILVQGQYKMKDVVDVDRYILWREGMLVFDGETVDQAVRKLNRFYGIPFSCDSRVRGIRLYGKLDINEPIENVLSAICSTAGLRYEMKDNGYNFVSN